MQLQSQRIRLRLLCQEDWPLFKSLYTSKQLMAHTCDALTEEEAEKMFNTRLQVSMQDSAAWSSFTICCIETGNKLGSIGIRVVNPLAKVAEVGFMLTTAAQGQGYASEALALVKQYAFTTLDLNKVTAHCAVSNIHSYQLLERNGFIREGRLLQNTYRGGQYIDDYCYGLCRP